MSPALRYVLHTLFQVFLTITLSSGAKNYPHFVELETEAQRVGPHGQSVAESGLNTTSLTTSLFPSSSSLTLLKSFLKVLIYCIQRPAGIIRVKYVVLHTLLLLNPNK